MHTHLNASAYSAPLRTAGLVLAAALVPWAASCGKAGPAASPRVSDRMAQVPVSSQTPGEPEPESPAARISPTTDNAVAPASSPPTSGPARAGDRPSSTSGGPAVATVNGEPIPLRDLVRILLDGRGLVTLQRMVQLEAVRQEGRRQGVTITPADIEQEYELALRADRYNGKDVEALTPARREQLIDEWTRSRGATREELAVAVERQAWLRKIVGDAVEPTPEQLQAEFDRRHGEKVEVRHIQIAAERVYAQLRQRLDQGEDFENLVADYSQNAFSRERRGLLPPFTRNDASVPGVFRETAFQLSEGQVSNPIEAEGSFHVLRLERRIPADGISFDDAKPHLEKSVRLRLTEERMEALGRQLLMSAELTIEDRTLREQYRSLQSSGRMDGPPLAGQ